MSKRPDVIITDGKNPIKWFINGFQGTTQTHDVKKVVDTTGAGDAFNAGFAAALTEGQNIKDALKFASATAGLSTTKIGTANSMPSREEIDKLL